MPSETVIWRFGRGLGAGPWTTAPSAMAYLLPWQGQSIVPAATLFTVQPWWVQIAENALNVAGAGCVTTPLSPANTVPPPTGMSLVRPNGLSAAGAWAVCAAAGARGA